MKKCTKLTDKKQAMDRALTWERAEADGRRGTFSEAQARKVLAEILERATGQTLITYTAETWLRFWIEGKEAAKSTGTHRKYRRTAESFLAHLGHRARLNVNLVKSGLSMAFRRLMERAGVAGSVRRVAKGKGRTINSLSFHSLRHSFNSAMANAGVSQELRQKLTGHASAAMNRLYTHHEVEPLRAAIGVIPTVEHKNAK